MFISELKSKKSLALIAAVALLLMLVWSSISTVYAATSMSPAANVILTMNGGTTVATFPAFQPILNASSTDVSTFYGVQVTPDVTVHATDDGGAGVFWRITVDHATTALSPGMVTVTEKGYYDQWGHGTTDSPYATTTVSGGNLVLNGNSGWGIESGGIFTNVDEITFHNAPTGVYTVTRTLVDASTTTAIPGNYQFTITLADVTGPAAPVINNPGPFASTSPINLSGTAEASSSITITHASSTTHATTTGGGSWSALVSLILNALNHIGVTATDSSGNTSATSTVDITHDNMAPLIVLKGSAHVEILPGTSFIDPGASTTDNLGGPVATTTSGSINNGVEGDYTITYGATDQAGNSTSTNRVVTVRAATSTVSVNSGGSGGNPGGSRHSDADIASAFGGSGGAQAQVTSGGVIGPTIPQVVLGPGQVLGIAIFRFPRTLRIGMRGEDVAELQRQLKEMGLFRVAITGYFGNITAASVRAFQRGLGLAANGQLDAQTISVLTSN